MSDHQIADQLRKLLNAYPLDTMDWPLDVMTEAAVALERRPTDRDIYRQALTDMVTSLRGQGEHVAADVVARNINRVIPRTLEETKR